MCRFLLASIACGALAVSGCGPRLSEAQKAVSDIKLGDSRAVVDAKLGSPDRRFTQYWGYYRIWLYGRGKEDALIGLDPNDHVVVVGTAPAGQITQQRLIDSSLENKRKPFGIYLQHIRDSHRSEPGA